MDSPNVPLLKSRTNFLKVSELYSQLIPPPFLSLTQDFFNHYDVTGKPNWDYLMSEFHFFHSIHVGDPTDPFYEFIFELLCELKCKESSVLDFCLHQYLRDRLMSYGFRGFAETAHLDRSEPYRKHITVPLPDLTIKYNNMVNDMCPFLLHDYQSYRHFVRFRLNIDVDKELRFYFMMDVIRTLKGHNEMPLMAMGEWTENFYALMRLMDKVPSNDFCDRRFALAMLIIDSLNQRYHIYSEESIRSLQLFFRTITDAYLPLDEMTRTLEELLDRHDDKEKKIKEYCGTYKEFFPEAAEPMQPRSLKHLARVQVRQCMTAANSIHFGVPDLRVPKTLEKYLLLED